jgi:hypothetical protein
MMVTAADSLLKSCTTAFLLAAVALLGSKPFNCLFACLKTAALQSLMEQQASALGWAAYGVLQQQ